MKPPKTITRNGRIYQYLGYVEKRRNITGKSDKWIRHIRGTWGGLKVWFVYGCDKNKSGKYSVYTRRYKS